MTHIVFNESELDLMKQVMELDESLAGEVLQVRDDFATGPLAAIHTEEGWQARIDWWSMLLEDSPYGEKLAGSFDDRDTVKNIIEKLEKDTAEEVWIWMGQNQHDVCGYYWLIPQLKDYQGRIMVLFLNNLPFINEKGHLFYPSWLQEIQPKEFLKAKKLSRPVTLSEFEIDPDEWKKIVDENAMVRILEGGKKIIGKEADYFDAEILKNITNEWQKASRILSNTLHRMKIKTGDLYLMWRIKHLINEGKLTITGNINDGWKAFDIRKSGVQQEETEITDEKEF